MSLGTECSSSSLRGNNILKSAKKNAEEIFSNRLPVKLSFGAILQPVVTAGKRGH
jgi:hypothetical protein